MTYKVEHPANVYFKGCPQTDIQSEILLAISHEMHSFALHKNLQKNILCSILCLCCKWTKIPDLVPTPSCMHEDGLV